MFRSTLILVVDDNEADSNYILELLKETREGQFEAVVARTMTEAMDAIKQLHVGLITLDLFLPDSEGLGTLTAIRAFSPETPVVVVTGLSDERIAKESVVYGAHAYLIKGEFDTAEFIRALTLAMARNSQMMLQSAIHHMQQQLAHIVAEVKAISDRRPAPAVAPAQTSSDEAGPSRR